MSGRWLHLLRCIEDAERAIAEDDGGAGLIMVGLPQTAF